MKIEYMETNIPKNMGPRYILRPENSTEQKFLTILRDGILGKELRLRLVGTENLEVSIPGLPAMPVAAAAFVIEDLKGEIPKEFLPQSVDMMDIRRHISQSESSTKRSLLSSTGKRKIRTTQQSGNVIVEEDR